MREIEICPSILSADFFNLGEKILELEKAKVNILHFDVMDGHFVKNISFGACVLESIFKKAKLFLDVHLMVCRPLNFIEQFIKAGASNITIHFECDDDILKCIEKVKELGCRCTIAVKPQTQIAKVKNFLGLIDMILVMTVNPGFSGQMFMEDMLKKIVEVKSINPLLKIQVDGGINLKNIKKAYLSGADWFVAGSYIFNSDNILKSVENLKEMAAS